MVLSVFVSRRNDFLGIGAKCLIFKGFAGRSGFLWITLLKTRLDGPQSLENQAFQQNAHAMGRI
jgi:hypothetical protein